MASSCRGESAMKETLSKQGARSVRYTILLPSRVIDDLRSLKEYTGQSTNDLINQLIEKELERSQDAVVEGRRLMIEAEERRSQAKARREALSKDGAPETVEEPGQVPAVEDAAEDDPGHEDGPTEAVRRIVGEFDDPRTMITLEDAAIWSQIGSESDASRRLNDAEEFVKWLRVEKRPGTLKDAEDYGAMYRELHKGRSKETNDKHVGRVRRFVRWWASQ